MCIWSCARAKVQASHGGYRVERPVANVTAPRPRARGYDVLDNDVPEHADDGEVQLT